MAAITVLSPTAWATDIDADTDTDVALPPVIVTATPASKKASSMDPVQARNRITPQALARRQADAVFTFMDEVPGVSVQGGARNSGKRFAIRGHSDSEDVRVEVDGVSKGFEKYRFGGTVSATTKDASDLLRPGQRWGARTRISHASNNQEGHAFVSTYGRLNDTLSMLAARTRREGDDIGLPDGRSLPLSATHMHSDLLKASWWATDAWKLSLSWLRYADQGLQAYDATGGANNSFGRVQRRIDDETLSLRSEWRDETAGHEWATTLGRQAGYHLLSASLTWRINAWMELGLSGENLLNTPYLLPGGQDPGAGLDGPGRNLRLSLGARY
jgi:hemoglobin/transferrin/lactoferrin receptor protein